MVPQSLGAVNLPRVSVNKAYYLSHNRKRLNANGDIVSSRSMLDSLMIPIRILLGIKAFYCGPGLRT